MAVMNEAWHETTSTIARRPGLYALLALGFFVPPALHAIWLLATTAPNVAPSPASTSNFGLLTAIVALWAQLAIVVAAASEAPGGAAARAGLRRLLPAIGLELVVVILFALLLLPLIVVLVRDGVDPQAMSSVGGASLSIGDAAVVVVDLLVAALLGIFVGARLLLVLPVVALERRGIGAFARSWRLTRGLTWRIVGVLLLFVVVIGVAVLAAQTVSGTAAALIAGLDSGVPALVAAIVGAAVTAALSVVAVVFTARLWHALDARRPA